MLCQHEEKQQTAPKDATHWGQAGRAVFGSNRQNGEEPSAERGWQTLWPWPRVALWVFNWAIYKTEWPVLWGCIYQELKCPVLEHLGAWKKHPPPYFYFRLSNLSGWEQGCALGWAGQEPRVCDSRAIAIFSYTIMLLHVNCCECNQRSSTRSKPITSFWI